MQKQDYYNNFFEIGQQKINFSFFEFKTINKLDEIIGEPREKYFYTLHFIKSQDNIYDEHDYTECRHYEKRKSIIKVAEAIIGLRELYPQCACRVLGIDAASNEIGCRPEVFASGFRYLRNHVKKEENQLPQLRITYHVGEDFLDIADGLRAIDEAINFLNMDCGDRLGHALALGLDVEEWYRFKNNRILIPQQDYLDNLVWLYNRLIEFEIPGMDVLKNHIEREYGHYFHIVYVRYMDYQEINQILAQAENIYGHLEIPNAFSNDRYNFGISQYYNAWKIRGDEPSLYSKGCFLWRDDGSPLANAYINRKFPKRYDIRYLPEVFLLNYYYHYNIKVRQEGIRRVEVKVKPYYIQGVKAVQKEMQRRIGQKGISIETNPSSNYLIGTFKSYEKHPIFNLYNKELTFDSYLLAECPQLSVSINSDDKGVFSTSLENEYALLACALEKAVDEEGKHIYNKSMVYEWINAVRIMGNEQSFMEKSLRDRLKGQVAKTASERKFNIIDKKSL